MEDLSSEPPTSINPYQVLNVEETATADQIKTAYRKAALKHHPDKVPTSESSTAHTKFQEIAFAYAILSSPSRKARYDATGRTEESLHTEDSDFNWHDFYRAQFADAITALTLESFKSEYQGSEEEEGDILCAYTTHEGDMDAIFEEIMLSSPPDDEDRFRDIIQSGIENGVVDAYPSFTNEPKAKRKRRLKNAQGEAEEARELAKELGVADKLFPGKDSKTKKGLKHDGDESALAALIQQRQKGRSESFLDQLEAKYAGKNAAKGNKSRKPDLYDEEEPSEEAFQKAAKRLAGGKKDAKRDGTATNGRRVKSKHHVNDQEPSEEAFQKAAKRLADGQRKATTTNTKTTATKDGKKVKKRDITAKEEPNPERNATKRSKRAKI